ncbi:glycosyltransferase family 2 protein [Luedemannella flava]
METSGGEPVRVLLRDRAMLINSTLQGRAHRLHPVRRALERATTLNTPTVSVIIPNYNYAKTLDLCLAAVNGQDYPAIEVIVIDDNSTDNSVEIARSRGRACSAPARISAPRRPATWAPRWPPGRSCSSWTPTSPCARTR